ncbi:MAG: ankyrin repeat domain-containing protein [Gemmatimonadaceae bacterium]
MSGQRDVRAAFIEAAVWHGTLDAAEAMLAKHPDLATRDIFTTAILGDDVRVRRFLAQDPKNATAKNGPHAVEPLVYLCLSKYLRLDKSRSAAFLRAATALLDAGADPNAGFLLKGEFETALYGAAGVAHHAEMTRLLLERGAVPDEEVMYHAAEEYDNDAMKVLLRSGKLSEDHLTTLLVRKIDWHDADGVQWLLENDALATRVSRWGFAPLGHALRRDTALRIIDALLDHGADPTAVADGMSGIAMAARGGRRDVLESLEKRGVAIQLQGVDELIAACAMGDTEGARVIAEREPHLVKELQAQGGTLLAAFAGTGNEPGVRLLLDLGVDVKALFKEGDGYYDIAKDSMAIHVAAWRASHDVVKLLIERGTPVSVPDGKGRTPLALAVKACVDSYWTEYRSPESVEALLRAGAKVEEVTYPSGYSDVDALLKAHTAHAGGGIG